MPFDGIVTGAMVRELSRCLTGGKIEKIYHPETDELILHVQKGKEKYRMLLSSGSSHARIHLIEDNGSNPQTPTGFCMLLRKHFQGGRIAEIRQTGSERIVQILVDSVNELGVSVNRGLMIELMGKHSNIIAVDLSTGKILDSIKRVSIDVSRCRQVLPGLPYTLPPSRGKRSLYTLNRTAFDEFTPDPVPNPAGFLVQEIQGFSPLFADSLCASSPECMTRDALWDLLQSLCGQIEAEAFSPAVYLDENGTPAEFHVFPLAGPETKKEFDSPSAAADFFFCHRESSNRIRQKSSDLRRALENNLQKQRLKKQRLSEDLLQAENSDRYRLYGELLTAALHLVPAGASSAAVPNYYDNSTLEIPLDPKYSPAKNAQRYFKKYAKSKTAIREKRIQLQETDDLIRYLESVLVFVENSTSIEEIEEIRQELVEGGYLRKRKNHYRPSKSKLQPYVYTTSDGFRMLVGRNNRENDQLTLKTADKKDIWFHTKDIPGSHVIVQTGGRSITETAIFEAAAAAAYYSKGKHSENVPVDYVSVRHVKKPSGAKPGMVIFTDNRTVYVNPKLPPDQKNDGTPI